MTRRRPPGMHREYGRARSDATGSAHRIIASGHARRESASDASKRAGDIAHETSLTNATARIVRKSTDARRRATKCLTLGTLDDEPSLIAKRVQQLACTADVVVWAHREQIFVASADAATKVLAELRIGIYGAGVLLAEIEDDMRRFRQSAAGHRA
jgi:hypothetical protein